MVRSGKRRRLGKRNTEAHHPLCLFDEKTLGRWKEIEVAKPVPDQVTRGGFLGTPKRPAAGKRRSRFAANRRSSTGGRARAEPVNPPKADAVAKLRRALRRRGVAA